MLKLKVANNSTFDGSRFRKVLSIFEVFNYDRFDFIVKNFLKECNNNVEHKKDMFEIISSTLTGLPAKLIKCCETLEQQLFVLQTNFSASSDAILSELKKINMFNCPTVAAYSLVTETLIYRYEDAVVRENDGTIPDNFRNQILEKFVMIYYRGLAPSIQAKLKPEDLKSITHAKDAALYQESLLPKEPDVQDENQSDEKYCAFHKSNTHSTNECKSKNCFKCNQPGHYASDCRVGSNLQNQLNTNSFRGRLSRT